MSDESKTNYKALIITGLISLAVAVVGNIIVTKFTEEKLLLTYDLVTSETFSSANGDIRIATLTVSNNGSKSVDDVSLIIDLPNGNIQEYKLTGLQPNTYTIDKNDNKVAVSTKFLNPTEKFNIQLLLNNPNSTDFLPFIDLRARGVLGSQITNDKKSPLLESVLTAILALITAMLFLLKTRRFSRTTPQIFKEIKHSDEQRDVVAYILSSCNLNSYADDVRNIFRKTSYWSISDLLTQKWIETNNPQVCIKGANTLEMLIDYAAINKNSILLIRSNIAKLYRVSGDIEKSNSILDDLATSDNQVIKLRINNIMSLESFKLN